MLRTERTKSSEFKRMKEGGSWRNAAAVKVRKMI